MKKAIIFLYFLLLSCGYSLDFDPILIKGNTQYTQQGRNQQFTSTVITEYRFLVYEHPEKKYNINVGGKVTLDLNHFGGTIKNNVFTTLGIDFW